MVEKLGDKIQIVGDDLFVTNTERLSRGIKEKSANSILIKAKLTGTKEILLSVGSDVLLPSSIQEATDYIQKRRNELTEYFDRNAKDRVQLEQIASGLQLHIHKIYNNFFLNSIA